MSLATGPVDDSLAQFQDRLESDWGGIQTKGANCFQRLLETLDEASLRTLLGGLAGKKWHRLGKLWSEIQTEYARLAPAAGKAKSGEKMAMASATLLVKSSFGDETFHVRIFWVEHWIAQMTLFQWSSGTGARILPLAEGCRPFPTFSAPLGAETLSVPALGWT